MKILDISAAETPVPVHTSAVLRGLRPALAWWCAAVTLATLGGYPGVIMLTPAAWMLAGWVGYGYAAHVRWSGLRPRMRLAALSGALYALALGVLFALVGCFAFQLTPDEVDQTLRLSLGVIGVGLSVCVPLSLATAWLVRRRVAF